MNGKRFSEQRPGLRRWLTGVLLWTASIAGPAAAQPVSGPGDGPPPVPPPTSKIDSGVVPASCSTCGGGLVGPYTCGVSGCWDGCNGTCYPGRKPCDCCDVPNNCIGRMFYGVYQCICCPDPCYEPHWNALADAAYFVDAPRPVTQMKFRYDHVWHYPFPDKAELLWPRADGMGKYVKNSAMALPDERSVSYRDFYLINETAIDRFGMSIAVPYRQMSTETEAIFPGASGLGDLIIGTKSLLIDCELLQFSFAFNTFVPTGNFTKGLGTGHVSLEPALLLALKVTPTLYLQSELAYRFPLGGDNQYQGPAFHYHMSLNQLLWNCGCDLKLIGTAELSGWEITGGAYTDPATGTPLSAKSVGDVLSLGPGLRFVVCDKLDFGAAMMFAVTHQSMGDEYLRVELRWRF
ncbi:MAG TPA: transporter [Gemmataceae bacterium]|nr:transporter [Gemmataceae bacterium]